MLRGYLIGGWLAASLWAQSPTFDQATKLYNRTDYEGSLRLLIAEPEKNARVYDLIGRNQFMLGEFKKASESYQQAVAADPSNSEYQHWPRKSFGQHAGTARPVSRPRLASEPRQQFAKSGALRPKNHE